MRVRNDVWPRSRLDILSESEIVPCLDDRCPRHRMEGFLVHSTSRAVISAAFMSVIVSGSSTHEREPGSADVAAMALRLSLPTGHDSMKEWKVESTGDVFSLSELPRVLSSQPKPVQCAATVEGPRVLLKCRTPASRSTMSVQRGAVEDILSRVRKEWKDSPGVKVAITAGESTLVVSLDAYVEWLGDYTVPAVSEVFTIPEGSIGMRQATVSLSRSQNANASMEIDVR